MIEGPKDGNDYEYQYLPAMVDVLSGPLAFLKKKIKGGVL